MMVVGVDLCMEGGGGEIIGEEGVLWGSLQDSGSLGWIAEIEGVNTMGP